MTETLSEVLRAVRMTGGVFLDGRFSAPWCLDTQLMTEDCRPILRNASQMICYHIVTAGRLVVWAGQAAPLVAEAGDIVILPRNDLHRLGSADGVAPTDARGLIHPSPDGGLARVSFGGDGPETRLICGFLGCDEGYNPLIAALPPVIKLNIRESLARGMIEASLEYAAGEIVNGHPPSSGVMARLSELLFVEAVRAYADSNSGADLGWLRGARDPQLGRALAAVHHDIAKTWRIEDMAREAGLSRSAFMQRFSGVVGESPLRYLARWRMGVARRLLAGTAQSVAQIAFAVGYESEAAFSRAFKRDCGVAPAAWRGGQRPEDRKIP